MRQILKNQAGFSMVESLIGAAMVGGIAIAIYGLSSNMAAISNQLASVKTIGEFKQQIMQTVNSNGGWRHSILASAVQSPALSCLSEGTDCASIKGRQFPLKVVMADGSTVLTDPNRPSQGFNRQGQVCSGFHRNEKKGDPNCPFRYEIFVAVTCPSSGPCTNPQEQIFGNLLYSPGQDRKIAGNVNPARYTFNNYRGELTNTLLEACKAFGPFAMFNPETKVCTLPLAGKCPVGHVVVRVDPATNQKDCRMLIAEFACGPNQVLKGIDANGVPYCVERLPCPCELSGGMDPAACCTGPNCYTCTDPGCIPWPPPCTPFTPGETLKPGDPPFCPSTTIGETIGTIGISIGETIGTIGGIGSSIGGDWGGDGSCDGGSSDGGADGSPDGCGETW